MLIYLPHYRHYLRRQLPLLLTGLSHPRHQLRRELSFVHDHVLTKILTVDLAGCLLRWRVSDHVALLECFRRHILIVHKALGRLRRALLRRYARNYLDWRISSQLRREVALFDNSELLLTRLVLLILPQLSWRSGEYLLRSESGARRQLN